MLRMSQSQYDDLLERSAGVCLKCQATQEGIEQGARLFCPSCEALYSVRHVEDLREAGLVKIKESKLVQETTAGAKKCISAPGEETAYFVNPDGKRWVRITKTEAKALELRAEWEKKPKRNELED